MTVDFLNAMSKRSHVSVAIDRRLRAMSKGQWEGESGNGTVRKVVVDKK